MVEERDLFFGRLRLHRMDRAKIRSQISQALLLEERALDARIMIERERNRTQRFPRQERAKPRIGGEQTMEHRRPRTLQAHDEDRCFDGKLEDLRTSFEERLCAQTIREHPE